MTVRLEHANVNVRDIDGMIEFLRVAFPEFRVRGEGKNWRGRRWVHIGNDETYVALNDATGKPSDKWVPYGEMPGTNHLGYEVDDADQVRSRLLAAGYRESTVPNSHPHRTRIYFYDEEGNDWEFVQYSSSDFAERNDYDLPDF